MGAAPGRLCAPGMTFLRTESPGFQLRFGCMAFSGGFLAVTAAASRPQVGSGVVTPTTDVIHLGCTPGATGSLDTTDVTVLSEDGFLDDGPIFWQ